MQPSRKALIVLLIGGLVLTATGVLFGGEPFQRNHQWLSWAYAIVAGIIFWTFRRREPSRRVR